MKKNLNNLLSLIFKIKFKIMYNRLINRPIIQIKVFKIKFFTSRIFYQINNKSNNIYLVASKLIRNISISSQRIIDNFSFSKIFLKNNFHQFNNPILTVLLKLKMKTYRALVILF